MRHLAVLLAATTALLAGCSSGDAPSVTEVESPVAATTPDAGAGPSLTIAGTDEVTWAEAMRSTAAGPVEVTIVCGPQVAHGLGIEGVQDGEELVACEGGGSETTTVELEAGEYTFFCTVPGHREAGMEGTLVAG